MRITSLRLKGVGPFKDTTLSFPPGTDSKLADVYLLVGKNGCGKTTALHALASALQPGQVVSDRPLEARFRVGETALVVVKDEAEHVWGIAGSNQLRPHDLLAFSEDHFEAPPFFNQGRLVAFAPVAHRLGWASQPPQLEPTAWASWFNGIQQREPGRLSWALFGYAGTRRVGPVAINSVRPGPMVRTPSSVNFVSSGNMQALAEWVANLKFRRLQAREEGKAEIEQAASQSIGQIEKALSEATGAPFAFVSTLNDFNLKASVRGIITELDLLPEGLKSVVAWLGDLMMNLDSLEWASPGPIGSREFLLLLDEIDVHLHPEWQRRILPVVQRTFPKAQIIVTTHSPFVVASLGDGAVIELALDDEGVATAMSPIPAPFTKSYSQTMASLFGIATDFDLETEAELRRFQDAGQEVRPGDAASWSRFEALGQELARRSDELAAIVRFELNQARRRGGQTGS